MTDLVDATDIDQWAPRRSAQGQLPQLVRRLIAESASTIHRLDFPSGEGVQQPGWDGIAEVSGAERFVPDGLSLWEVGTSGDARRKAEDDYRDRTNDPLGVDPSRATYVAVTARRWSGKRDWVESKADGPWKEVLALDAGDLEVWLQDCPATHAWISVLLGKDPRDAAALTTWWESWAGATSPQITGDLLLAGRDEIATGFVARVMGPAGAVSLVADSPDEAIAFVAAALGADDRFEAEQLLTRAVVVHSQTGWRRSVAAERPGILIPMIQDVDVRAAIAAGHHVLIPTNRRGNADVDSIDLGRVRRAAAREALRSMRVPDSEIERITGIARRSLVSVRRTLSIAPQLETPPWAAPEESPQLMPALLAGVWEEGRDGDREALSQLAARPYEEVARALTRWSSEPDPPVRRVGDTWMLLSKEDAWQLLSAQLTASDLTRFREVVSDVLGTPDPSLELPQDEQWMAAVRGVVPRHSGLLRRGLADTLALMASRSGDQQLANGLTGQELASILITELLGRANEDESGHLWTSLADVLPLLAEAAPDAFLDALNAGAADEEPVIMKMFTDSESSDPLFSRATHSGLLWALETLAWSPAYLGGATFALGRLARLDRGGTWANRPENSLREIFLPWHPQTSASLAIQMVVLDALLERESDVATKLLAALLPESRGIASPTHAPQWRGWRSEPSVTHAEWGEAIELIATRLVKVAEASPEAWFHLIDRLSSLPRDVQDAVLSSLERLDPGTLDSASRSAVAEAVRAEAARHRRFPDAQWTMPTDQVQRLEATYEHLAPDDPVETSVWLFTHHPDVPEQDDRDWDAYRQRLDDAREAAIAAVFDSNGLSSIEALAGRAEVPFEVGRSLSSIEIPAESEEIVFGWMDPAADALQWVARGYVFGRFADLGWDWADETLEEHTDDWSPTQQAEFFLGLPYTGQAWDWIERLGEETASQYWSSVPPMGLLDSTEYERMVAALLQEGRPLAAVDLLGLYVDSAEPPMSSALIADVLESAATTSVGESVSGTMLQYHVARLLDHIEASQELDDARVARLEWLYLPLLRYGDRPPKLLHQELATNPGFFAEVVTWIFRGEGEEREPTEEAQTRAQAGFHLLESWKGLPGLGDTGTVDPAALREWVVEARSMLHEQDRAAIGDQRIGSVLRYSPVGGDGVWPHEAVRDLIEELGAEHLERGIEVQVYNSRGVTSPSLTSKTCSRSESSGCET